MPRSMAPKIEACLQVLDHGGSDAIICAPADLELALRGKAGTRIVH